MKKIQNHVKGILYSIIISVILITGSFVYIHDIQNAGYPFEDLEPTQIKKVVLYFDDMPDSHNRYPTYDLPADKIKQLVDILHRVKIYERVNIRPRGQIPMLFVLFLNENSTNRHIIDLRVYKQYINISPDYYRASEMSCDAIADFYQECYQIVCDSSRGPSYPFKALELSDIKNIKIYFSAEPYILPVEVTETLVETLHNVVIYDVEKNSQQYTGGNAPFEIELNDGICIQINAADIFFSVNGVCYRSERGPNNVISQIYYDYLEIIRTKAMGAQSSP